VALASALTADGNGRRSGYQLTSRKIADMTDSSPVAPDRSRWRQGNSRPTGQEQYYTPEPVARQVVETILARYPGAREQVWVEPCAGTGRFLDAFAAAGITRVWAGDTIPHDPRVQLQDFLTWEPVGVEGAIVATNPPFGRNHALSVPFFNRAARFASVIAFIVPRTWRRWSVINRLDPVFHLVEDQDLSVYFETPEGKYVDPASYMRTCIQIWERRSTPRARVVIPDRGYIRKVDPRVADVRLTFVAQNCGLVTTEFPRIPSTIQMYFAVRDPEVLEALHRIDYSRFAKNVTHIQCVSYQEVLFLLNEYFDRRDNGASGEPLDQRAANGPVGEPLGRRDNGASVGQRARTRPE
jgi:hypothetical protein